MTEAVDIESPEDVSDEEKERVRADVVHFVRNYCQLYDPRLEKPYFPFDLFPIQEECLRWLEERLGLGESGCLEKSRDVGASTLLCAFLLHRWLFREGFAGGVGSRKLEYVDNPGDPKSLFEKIRFMLRRLPWWMMPKGFSWDKHSFEGRLLNPATGGSIIGEGGAHIGRGGRTTVYIVDEYNFLERPDLADAALRDNSNTIIYTGTPNGLVGIYKKKSFLPTFTISWRDDPRKDESWYQKQVDKHRDSPWIVKQEIDIDYLGSGSPKFNRDVLLKLMEACPDPMMVEDSPWSGEVKTWRQAFKGGEYVIVADVAEGIQSESGDPDFSKAHVYDLRNWEQVCRYHGRMETHEFAVDLAALGELYNSALVVVERTGPGLSVLSTLTEECSYPNVWHTVLGENNSRAGWMATARSKKQSDDDLASYIGDMKEGFASFVWNSKETLEELFHYVVKPNGRCEAEPGYHDDEVSCCRMAADILPQLSVNRYDKQYLNRALEQPPKPRVLYG